MALFDIRNLTFTYPGASAPALQDVNLRIRAGDCVLICGQSGSGKSTLLRHLKTVLTPHGSRTGCVLFRGKPLEEASLRDQAADIGFVLQNPDDQAVTDKVWHELAFGLENLGCDPGTMRLRVAEMASFFGIQDWFHREVCQLSGGQKQLLNLAAVMVMQPEVLILDEPTSQLDPIAAGDFLNTLKKINRELGTTILITEHRIEDIFPSADLVVVMEKGRIVTSGDPRQTAARLHDTGSPLLPALPAPARAFYEVCGHGQPPLTVREGRRWLTDRYPDGPSRPALPPEPAVPRGDVPALELRDVWFRYDGKSPDILRGLNLRVPPGCLFAIVGGNGTGKSTALRTVCGICRPWRGSVRLFGQKLSDCRGHLFEGLLTMLPQDPRCLFVKGSLREELEEMCTDPGRIRDLSCLCEVDTLLDAHPADLSGGEIQRAALCKVLLTKPRLLLLDEPTKGMDSLFKQKFAALLHRLCTDGLTVVLVSHDVEFCAEYADLVGLFFDGQLLTSDTPRRFFGSNSFYTTAASRMSRNVFRNAVTVGDISSLIRLNEEDSP